MCPKFETFDCTVTGIPLADCDEQHADTHKHTATPLSHCSQPTASFAPVMRTSGPAIYRSLAPQRALEDSVKLGPS